MSVEWPNTTIKLVSETTGDIYDDTTESSSGLESYVDWNEAYGNLELMLLDLILECQEQIEDLENGTYRGHPVSVETARVLLKDKEQEIERIRKVDANDRAAVALVWVQYKKRLNQKADQQAA